MWWVGGGRGRVRWGRCVQGRVDVCGEVCACSGVDV